MSALPLLSLLDVLTTATTTATTIVLCLNCSARLHSICLFNMNNKVGIALMKIWSGIKILWNGYLTINQLIDLITDMLTIAFYWSIGFHHIAMFSLMIFVLSCRNYVIAFVLTFGNSTVCNVYYHLMLDFVNGDSSCDSIIEDDIMVKPSSILIFVPGYMSLKALLTPPSYFNIALCDNTAGTNIFVFIFIFILRNIYYLFCSISFFSQCLFWEISLIMHGFMCPMIIFLTCLFEAKEFVERYWGNGELSTGNNYEDAKWFVKFVESGFETLPQIALQLFVGISTDAYKSIGGASLFFISIFAGITSIVLASYQVYCRANNIQEMMKYVNNNCKEWSLFD